MLALLLVVIWVGVAGTALFAGLDYYMLPVPERAYSDLAPLYAPTGLVGHGLGIVGTGLILLGVVGYMARKHIRPLGRLGPLKHWLQVHIFLCTLGPFLVLLHTTFKFGGLVSIAFWSMAVVVASGVFGRYVYVRIPKTINGRFLELATVTERVRELTAEIAARVGLPAGELETLLAPAGAPPAATGLGSALGRALVEDFSRGRQMRGVRRYLRSNDVPSELHAPVLGLVREQRRLRQQALLLQPFQRMFRYWHVVHLPLALVMFLVLAVHVFVAVLFGYTWVF